MRVAELGNGVETFLPDRTFTQYEIIELCKKNKIRGFVLAKRIGKILVDPSEATQELRDMLAKQGIEVEVLERHTQGT